MIFFNVEIIGPLGDSGLPGSHLNFKNEKLEKILNKI